MRVYDETLYTSEKLDTLLTEYPVQWSNDETDDIDLFTDVFTHLAEWSPDETGEVKIELTKAQEPDEYQSLKRAVFCQHAFAYVGAKKVTESIIEAIEEISEKESRGAFDFLDDETKDRIKETMLEDSAVKAATAAEDEISQIREIMAEGCGEEKGTPGAVDINQAVKLSEMLKDKPQLKEIIDQMGRWEDTFASVKSNKEQGITPVGVEIGGEISRLVPSETAMLSVAALRPIFMAALMERRLLQYEIEAEESDESGPLIILLDQSGSMASMDVVSKGFVFAAARHLRKEGRELAVIPFDYNVPAQTNWYFSTSGTAGLVRFSSMFLGGGTDFVKPILSGIELSESKMPNADILLISDGMCHIGVNSLDDFKKRMPGKFKTILMSTTRRTDELRELGEVISISSFLDRNAFAAAIV